MIIRPSTEEDSAEIDNLLITSYTELMKNHYSPNILHPALVLIAKSRPELLSSGTYFVATTNSEKIIGCGGWTKYSPDTKETQSNIGHVRHFAIHPNYTKQGIGRKIFENCQTQAQKNSISEFECYSSLNAENFYKSLGFKTISTTEIPLSPDVIFPCLFMKKYL